MQDSNNHVFTEIEIEAAPADVWRVFTDWGKLKDWSSSIIGISTEKPVVGESFITYLKNPLPGKPLELFHTCTEYEEERIFGWSGTMLGPLKDHHIYSIEPTLRGTTIFRQEDGFHGPLNQLANFLAAHKMKSMYNKFNRELKNRVESLYPKK